jgi:hypothetical protein
VTASSKPNRSVKSFTAEAEQNARLIRSAAGYGDSEIICPVELANRLGYSVMGADDLLGESDGELSSQVAHISPKKWSALGIPSARLIIYNPNQTAERRSASIMEEVAHFFLGHSPSTITVSSESEGHRSFDGEGEKMAYWTGAAVLVPAAELSRAVWRRVPLQVIASEWGVSVELVEFRTKVLGLWREAVNDRAA